MLKIGRHSLYTWLVISSLLAILIAINTYIARSTVQELNVLQSNIKNTGDVMVALDDLHIGLLSAQTAQRAFLLMQDEQYLKGYRSALKNMDDKLHRVRELKSDISGQQLLIVQVSNLIEQMLIVLEQRIEQANTSKNGDVKKASSPDEQLYPQIKTLFERLASTENDHRAQLSLSLKKVTTESRTTFVLSLVISLILLTGMFLLARTNISFQKQRQREIEEQNASLFLAVEERTQSLSIYSEELKRSNRELEDFAFVASHDLQEPLRKIQTFSDRLQSLCGDTLGDKGADYLSRMQSAAQRMSQLISDLLAFSRISTRGKPFEELDLNALINDCLEDLSVKIEEQDAQINVAHMPIMQADPTQMRQLFSNLLLNALKFSLPSVTSKVDITLRQCSQPEHINLPDLDQWYEITISDNGIGFEQEHADKIFVPFQRLHSTKEYKGTGIGLSICRRIVERHNGEISAVGQLNKGATFKIVLPGVNYLSQLTDSEINNEYFE
jgi:signal transduction histidine kinase